MKLGLISAVGLLATCFCIPSAAREDPNAEKISIVNRIVETKFREGSELSEIFSAVAEKLPLGSADAELTPEVISSLKEKVREKFPSTQKELEAKYAVEAEKKFPVYHAGETVTVYYRIYGGTFDRVTGKFYRQDPNFVWIGNKKIAKADLQKDYVPRFDSVRVEQLKKDYIIQNVTRYLKQKNSYEDELKENTLHELRGEIRYKGKWMSLRKLVKKKYQETKEAELIREKIMFVEQAIAKAKEVRTYEEAIEILKSVIKQYPDAENIDQAKELCAYYEEKAGRVESARRYWKELMNEFPDTVNQGRSGALTDEAFLRRLINFGEKASFISENLNLSSDQRNFLKCLVLAKDWAKLYFMEYAARYKNEAVDCVNMAIKIYKGGL